MDKYILLLLVSGTLFFIILVLGIIAYVFAQKSRQNKYQEEKQKLILEYHQSLLAERERTMVEIASDIHDNTAQMLSQGMRILSDAMEVMLEGEALKLSENANEIFIKVADDLHYLGHSLGNNYLRNLGLAKALTKDMEYISSSGKLVCEFDIQGKYERPEFERELLIYRILQEAIHNTIKHANATQVIVTLYCGQDKLLIEFSDNGRGYVINQEERYGIGINNMYQRAELLKGNLHIESETGKGVRIKLDVPVRSL